MPSPNIDSESTALVIAHPGHELHLLGWVGRRRPLVAILTDGSGSSANSRLHRSEAVFTELGCTLCPDLQQASDRRIYQRILDGDVDFFWQRVECLSDQFHLHAAELVVSDMREGYSPTHDLAEALTHLAVTLCRRRHGRAPAHFTFPLTGGPGTCPEGRSKAETLELTHSEFEHKLRTARGYEELAGELAALEKSGSLEIFKTEHLFRAGDELLSDDYLEREPYYETYGRKQVEKGLYSYLLTYRDHIRPLLVALQERLPS